MGKKGKNTAKKKAARQESKATEKSDRELKKNLPAKLDSLLAKGKEETKDIDLFAVPPPKEECSICLHPHSLGKVCGFASFGVSSCCGKKICRGCMHASELRIDKINIRKKENKEPLLPYTCAFCRTPFPKDPEEDFERFQERAVLNNDKSIMSMATSCRYGYGTSKNMTKSLDLYCCAAELGSPEAYGSIDLFYRNGIIVEKSLLTAIAFTEIAAKKGDIMARHTLGATELQRGNHAVALRHFKIAAEAGYQMSLDALKAYLKMDNGLLGEEEFAEILRKFLASKAEMKTDQRDAWVKYTAAEESRILRART